MVKGTGDAMDENSKQDFWDNSDDDDANPIDFWEKKQRELITSVVDYNLGTLTELVVNKDINIAPRYQRRFRWDENRQSKLIESF